MQQRTRIDGRSDGRGDGRSDGRRDGRSDGRRDGRGDGRGDGRAIERSKPTAEGCHQPLEESHRIGYHRGTPDRGGWWIEQLILPHLEHLCTADHLFHLGVTKMCR
ncbi:MAG: hypothetical protein EI684_19060 [Candidatus Viridilinea halotolerans]|uniref:Uncharacterized protein n=1 Tax=Candidatus Viridilinea halotolerans TaxID=2491704 RepID=A0A426TSY5_9CHLR|nr:MAG: hypothetical protein EI684_19060 [Candidatus Viridilinea halotolerans]